MAVGLQWQPAALATRLANAKRVCINLHTATGTGAAQNGKLRATARLINRRSRQTRKRSFPCTLTPTLLPDVLEWESVRFDQATVVLAKLKGSRSLMSASPARCGNSVRTWRNQANGSTPQARQVNIRL